VQDLQRPRIVFEVDLEAPRALERPAPERPDLSGDAIGTKQGERASGDRWARDLEVERDTTAPAKVDASRRADESGELGEAAAGLARVDSCELRADVFREHARAPEGDACTRGPAIRMSRGRSRRPRGGTG